MSRSYKLTESSVRSINRTIRTVKQMRTTGANGDLPFRQNARKGGGAGATLQIGKTTASWGINTEATLDVWVRNADTGDMEPVTKDDGTAVTFTAYNTFADIDDDKFVGCMSGFLIAAQCG